MFFRQVLNDFQITHIVEAHNHADRRGRRADLWAASRLCSV